MSNLIKIAKLESPSSKTKSRKIFNQWFSCTPCILCWRFLRRNGILIGLPPWKHDAHNKTQTLNDASAVSQSKYLEYNMNSLTATEVVSMGSISLKWSPVAIHNELQKNLVYVSKKRSSTINSRCFGEYHATAFAEPRTCNAYSMARTGSSTCIGWSRFFKSTANPESTLILKGPAIWNTQGEIVTSHWMPH